MVDMHEEEPGNGILVDMIYENADGIEKVVDVKIYEIINSIVTGIVTQVSPIIKVAFAGNMLKLLEIERNKNNV